MQYVLEEGNGNDWFEDRTITVLAVVAAIALIGFVTHELEHEHPVVDLRVFRNRAYAAATTLNFLVGTAIFAGSVLLSLYCGTILHYRALAIRRVFLIGTRNTRPLSSARSWMKIPRATVSTPVTRSSRTPSSPP